MPNSTILTVKMREVAIKPAMLIDLAGEYYGVVAVPAGDGDPEEMDIEFKDHLHPVLKTNIRAKECVEGLMAALDSYRLPK